MISPSAALALRVQNVEQEIKSWDSQFGHLLSIAGESRDASVQSKEIAQKACDEVAVLTGLIRDLKIAIATRCDERCGALRDDVRELQSSSASIVDDGFDLTTDIMDRNQLVESRHTLKRQMSDMVIQMRKLEESEEKRAQAERDKEIAQKAHASAIDAFDKAQANSAKDNAAKSAELEKEKIKSRTSIVLAVLGIVGGVAMAAASFYWG